MILVVGGGVSAGYLAAAVAERGNGYALRIISDEDVLPYERPTLTKAALWKENPMRLPSFLTTVGTRGTAQSKEWYKDHGIEIILNTRIASVDVSARSVVTSDGDRIQYKHLVIATGCTSIKIPPEVGGDLPGVHYIRSYKSIMALYQDLKVCENAVIVGGGQYALEAAVSIAAWGVNVDVVVKEPNIMHDVWPATLASIFEDDFRSRNVTFYFSANIRKIFGAGQTGGGFVKCVELDDGQLLNTDVVIVDLGSKCNTGLFEGLDRAENNSIKVNSQFLASGGGAAEGSVYAIGDVASFPLHLHEGKHVRCESVEHARKSAFYIAEAIFSKKPLPPYHCVPNYYSRINEDDTDPLLWHFYGVARGDVLTVGCIKQKQQLGAFWVKGNKCVGALITNGTSLQLQQIRDSVEKQRTVNVAALQEATTLQEAMVILTGLISRKYVVVGGGMAAGYLAKAFVDAGKGHELCILTDEKVVPYERPDLVSILNKVNPGRLSSFFTGANTGEPLQSKDWYAMNNISLCLRHRVVATDFASKKLTLNVRNQNEEQVMTYQKLIVATGCAAVRFPDSMGGDLNGIHYIRQYDDMLRLYEDVKQARNVVLVMRGYIGLDVAETLATWGPVTVVLLERQLMSRMWPQEVATRYEKEYVMRGITFRTSTMVKRFIGNFHRESPRVTCIEMEDGARIEADVVAVSIGSRPQCGPFHALRTDSGGILVDSFFQATGEGVDPGSVYAIGDVAAIPLPIRNGIPCQMEQATNAISSARHLAKILLLRETAPYEHLPHLHSSTVNKPGRVPLDWVFYGVKRGTPVVVGKLNPQLIIIWIHEGRISAVFLAAGSPSALAALPSTVRARPCADEDAIKQSRTVSEALELFGIWTPNAA